MEMTMRTNLKVPYEEKDTARKLGARWDAARKVWYVENVENLSAFLKWIPGAVNSVVSIPSKTVTGHRFFRTGCNCLPWEPCPSCVDKVASAGWGLPA